MKLYFSLIFILSIVFNCCNGNLSNQFVNFQYYSDSSCENEYSSNTGFGFSFSLDTCLTLDNWNNYIFRYDQGEISWSQYYNQGTNNGTCENLVSNSKLMANGVCLPYSFEMFNFNKNYYGNESTFYYKINVASKPTIPSGAIVTTQMGERCIEDNIVAVQFWANKSTISDGSGYLYSFCNHNGVPFQQSCSDDGCLRVFKIGEHCKSIFPFYNASSSTETSSEAGSSFSSDSNESDSFSGCATGKYSTSGDGNCVYPSGIPTGTGSATSGIPNFSGSGYSTSSSGGLLKDQNQNDSFGGRGDSKIQIIQRKYYQSIYCS